jgi:hypothetical protein
MIDTILKLIELSEYYGISKNIDIAKGINKTPMTIREGLKRQKRIKAWQKKKL